MSNFKIKSEKNLEGSKLLIKNSFYSSSVHCSYYSNIQFILHILLKDVYKTTDELDRKSKLGSNDKKGFHNWIKSEIIRELFYRDYMSIRNFNNYFGQLKKLRINADYLNELINKETAEKGLNLSITINEILAKGFKV